MCVDKHHLLYVFHLFPRSADPTVLSQGFPHLEGDEAHDWSADQHGHGEVHVRRDFRAKCLPKKQNKKAQTCGMYDVLHTVYHSRTYMICIYHIRSQSVLLLQHREQSDLSTDATRKVRRERVLTGSDNYGPPLPSLAQNTCHHSIVPYHTKKRFTRLHGPKFKSRVQRTGFA